MRRDKFISKLILLKFKTMNVTEQSIVLSSYPSGEILSARQKADNGRPKGDVFGKRLLVTGDAPTETAVCGFRLADRISPDR